MVGSSPHQAEFMGSQRQDHLCESERQRNQEGSVHTTHTSRSQAKGKSHVSREDNTRNMQREINHLRRSLRHERRRRTPSNLDFSSNNKEDKNYRHQSRTPLSKTFSYDEDYHHERRDRNSSPVGLGNDAMSRTLSQITKSPFTRWIETGRLPQRFSQPTFTMYNRRTDPAEHVNHFNQRMVVHSKNEPLMCKVFPSSLGPVAMRWFNSLRVDSIDSFKELTQAFRS